MLSSTRWYDEAAAHDLAADTQHLNGCHRLARISEEAAEECRRAGRRAWLRENPTRPATDDSRYALLTD